MFFLNWDSFNYKYSLNGNITNKISFLYAYGEINLVVTWSNSLGIIGFDHLTNQIYITIKIQKMVSCIFKVK